MHALARTSIASHAPGMLACSFLSTAFQPVSSRAHERSAIASGASVVFGVDESGVGSIAGPLFAAAVHLPDDWDGEVGDSKAMSRAERHDAFKRLVRTPGVDCACVARTHRRIDAIGARKASEEAMVNAAATLRRRLLRRGAECSSVHCLVDGANVPAGLSGIAVRGGDRQEAAIAAASVVATVAHDAALCSLARRWPLWDFEVNLGHPSRLHLRRILSHGPSGIHRTGCFPFAPRRGRRLSFHPDRNVYRQVQRLLREASQSPRTPDEVSEEVAAMCGSGASEDSQSHRGEDARQRADRLQRYRRFARRMAAAPVVH